MKKFLSLVLLASLFAPLLMSVTGCSSEQGSNPAESAPHALHMADLSTMAVEVQNAPERVSEAYRFAVENPEATKNVPCFCGCGPIGHTNNYDCYVQDAPTNGAVVFDPHALGCVICVDITQDVMRMTAAGRAPPQIRQAIINTYSRYGPSNQSR